MKLKAIVDSKAKTHNSSRFSFQRSKESKAREQRTSYGWDPVTLQLQMKIEPCTKHLTLTQRVTGAPQAQTCPEKL